MSFFLISFLFLLGAAALGYAISRVWIEGKIVQVRSEMSRLERGYLTLRGDYDELTKESSTLQSEKIKLKNQLEVNRNKLIHQKEVARQLEQDKEFIFGEYENFRNAAKEKLEASQKIIEAFDSLKGKTQKEKIKTDKWKIKYHDAVQSLQNVEAEARKLKKEKEALIEQSKNSASTSSSLFEWETNYKELKLRYLALAKEKKDLETSLNEIQLLSDSVNESKNDNAILKKEIEQLEKENQKLVEKLEILIKSNKTKSKETIFDRIKSRSDQVDFKRIGKAFDHQKDDLKKLDGLTESVEKRFNAIGIYQFKQLASFNPQDEVLFNQLLELPNNKIQKEGWVVQARSIVNEEEDPQVILSRIGNRKDHIDFSRIGEASPTKKDNLQLIKGIGPFIEKKLNALGIYRIKQIAFFNEEDIEEINEIIELGSGHIKTDDWVGQAKRMK